MSEFSTLVITSRFAFGLRLLWILALSLGMWFVALLRMWLIFIRELMLGEGILFEGLIKTLFSGFWHGKVHNPGAVWRVVGSLR
jgi:hypothetical protein